MIYVDYLSTINIINGIARYTGGTNYANNVLSLLLEQNLEDISIIIPSELDIKTLPEFLKENIAIIRTDALCNVNYTMARVLYLPQVNGTVLRQLKSIKTNYPKLKIYGTLHDRQHNCFTFDYYNLYYTDKLFNKFKMVFEFYLKKIAFDFSYSRWVNSIDKIFTVSNYSLQKLNDKNVKYINYFIQDDYTLTYKKDDKLSIIQEPYCLMVGAGRPEKNCLRTLEAFCAFHKENEESLLKIVLTGVDDNTLSYFKASKKIDYDIFSKYVVTKGYVSYEDLDILYKYSSFVVFTSKAEGFGLPALEAIKRNKTVMASRVTSIPEVLGSSAYYVNPYDVQSIKDGFYVMSNPKTIELFEKRIKKRKDVLTLQIENDKETFLEELLS